MRVHIQAAVDTAVPAALVREALLDFSPRRLEIWSETLDPATYVVHTLGETSAEVTEGNRRPKLWSRERYDWSAENVITRTTQDSDFCTPGSFISMTITPRGSGSRVGVVWDRIAAGFKGRVWLFGAKVGGDRLLKWATRRALANVAAKLTP